MLRKCGRPYLRRWILFRKNPDHRILRDKFHHDSLNDTIDLCISHILSYQERLANTRQRLPDEDVITKLLTALRLQHTILLKEIIFNQPDRTIATVIAALRRHAEIIQLTEAPSNPTGGAGGSTVTRGLLVGKHRYSQPPSTRASTLLSHHCLYTSACDLLLSNQARIYLDDPA